MAEIAAIVSAIGTIIASWFAYNQYTKNKMTDMKVEQYKADMEIKKKRRSDNSALVYGEIWEVRHELDADRVYIVQPHPLGNESMVSVYFEAKRKGVESMKPHIQNLKMGEIGKFCADLASNKFLEFSDIDDEVNDRYAKALLCSCGTTAVVVRKLSDNTHDWVGSIFCEFTHKSNVDEERIKSILNEAATNIQFILPEYRD